jgi:hypothetical protein
MKKLLTLTALLMIAGSAYSLGFGTTTAYNEIMPGAGHKNTQRLITMSFEVYPSYSTVIATTVGYGYSFCDEEMYIAQAFNLSVDAKKIFESHDGFFFAPFIGIGSLFYDGPHPYIRLGSELGYIIDYVKIFGNVAAQGHLHGIDFDWSVGLGVKF